MWITLLAKLLLFLGLGVLISLIIKVVTLTLKAVLTKVKKKLSQKYGRKCFIVSVKKLGQEIIKEAERSGNVHSVDDMLREMGEDGIAMGVIDEDGTIDDSDIEILSAQSIDEGLHKNLDRNDGQLVFA